MSEKALKITSFLFLLSALMFLSLAYLNTSNKNLSLFNKWDEPLYVINLPYITETVLETTFPVTREEVLTLQRKAKAPGTKARETRKVKKKSVPTRTTMAKPVRREKTHSKHSKQIAKPNKVRKLFRSAMGDLNRGNVIDAAAKLSYIVQRYPGTKEAKIAQEILKGEIPTFKEAKARRLFIEAQKALGEKNKLRAAYLLKEAYSKYPETKYGKLSLSLLKKLEPE